MGYSFKNINELSYHHNLLEKQYGGKETFENGAILNQKTSHNYLHLIEQYEPEMYIKIIYEMMDENLRGIQKENLKEINKTLIQFEEMYKNTKNSKGKRIIKREYLER